MSKTDECELTNEGGRKVTGPIVNRKGVWLGNQAPCQLWYLILGMAICSLTPPSINTLLL